MAFWTYMLHCADRTFYVGHTDDLEKRIGQHEHGALPGYTSDRLPVKLVWTQDFATRDEARSAEARLKGWSRAKKLALIRSDWANVSVLARSSKAKERASTGSAKSVFSAQRFLHPHLDQPPAEPLNLEVGVRAKEGRLTFRFRLTGLIDQLAIPDPAPSGRQDELWRHTCFEAFVQSDNGTAYVEFNFSPTSQWAAYAFESYRTGMSELAVDPPQFRCDRKSYELNLVAAVRIPDRFNATRLALSAVIEESSGRKSYWALAHPAAKPDFHHPDSFVLTLPEHQ